MKLVRFWAINHKKSQFLVCWLFYLLSIIKVIAACIWKDPYYQLTAAKTTYKGLFGVSSRVIIKMYENQNGPLSWVAPTDCLDLVQFNLRLSVPIAKAEAKVANRFSQLFICTRFLCWFSDSLVFAPLLSASQSFKSDEFSAVNTGSKFSSSGDDSVNGKCGKKRIICL